MTKEYNLFDRIKIALISILFFIGYKIAYSSHGNVTGRLWGINYNLGVTVLIALMCALIYFGLSILLGKIKLLENDFTRGTFLIINLFAFLIAIGFIIYCYYHEFESAWYGEDFQMMFARERFPRINVIMAVIVVAAAILLAAKKMGRIMPGFARKILAVLVALFGGVLSYAPNAYQNQAWWFYHVHAYTTSIVNVMNKIPFSDTTNSIYGHYGLIYYPFVKLMGDNYYAVMRTVAFFCALSFMAAFYVLDKLIENDWIYCISIVACIGTVANYFAVGFLFQEFPGRTLFPMITLAYLVGANRLKKMLYYALGLLVGTLAIVFNIETGICCLGTIAITWICREWGWTVKQIALCIIKSAIAVGLCFSLAYGIVNLYNLCNGGETIGLNTFIYPFGSNDFNIQSVIRTNYPSEYSWHTLRSIIFCGVGFEAARRLFTTGDKQTKLEQERKLAIGVNGMSVLILYINHCSPAYLPPSHMQLIMLLAVLAKNVLSSNKFIDYKKSDSVQGGKFAFSLLAFSILIYFMMDCVVTLPRAITNREDSVWETETLNQQYDYLSSILPRDVPAFGFAIPEIYYQLGVDTKVYTSDWAGDDTTFGSVEEAEKAFRENDKVIMSGETAASEDIVPIWTKYGFKEATSVDFQWFRLVLMTK